MALGIKWTKRASENLDETIEYLLTHYSGTTVKKFITKVEEAVLLISRHPKIGKKDADNKDARDFVVSRQVTLFYRLVEEK